MLVIFSLKILFVLFVFNFVELNMIEKCLKYMNWIFECINLFCSWKLWFDLERICWMMYKCYGID